MTLTAVVWDEQRQKGELRPETHHPHPLPRPLWRGWGRRASVEVGKDSSGILTPENISFFLLTTMYCIECFNFVFHFI